MDQERSESRSKAGDPPISLWLAQLKQGDTTAAARIWQEYYTQLVRLARRKLAAGRRRIADEEDIVLSAFDSFFRRVAEQRFPRLDDRHDLWQVLLMITERKACDLIQWERRGKRGGGRVRGESAFGSPDQEHPAGIGLIVGAAPSPEFVAEVVEQCESLLARLADDKLRMIAMRKLAGHSNSEIADELGCGERTVERKLSLIRAVWGEDAEPS